MKTYEVLNVTYNAVIGEALMDEEKNNDFFIAHINDLDISFSISKKNRITNIWLFHKSDRIPRGVAIKEDNSYFKAIESLKYDLGSQRYSKHGKPDERIATVLLLIKTFNKEYENACL